MSIVVIGVNHRTAPLAVLERLAIAPDDLAKAVAGSSSRDNIREAAVLSTCGRTEVYLVAERFHGAYADVTDFLADARRAAARRPARRTCSAQHDEAAAAHLFEVAAGLDSAVLGESEILGQVRAAWQVARPTRRRPVDARPAVPPRPARRQAGPHRDGDRARHDVDQPRRRRDGHRPARQRSPAAACSSSAPATWAPASPPRCARAGADDITVANRTPPRGAEPLAASVGGAVVGFDELADALGDADVVVTLRRRRRSLSSTADTARRRGAPTGRC